MRKLKKTLVLSVMLSVVIAWIPLALFVLLEKVIPAIAPGLIWTVPVGVAGGFLVLWRMYPRDAYPIGLVYVPVVGGMLLWAVLRLIWHMGRWDL